MSVETAYIPPGPREAYIVRDGKIVSICKRAELLQVLSVLREFWPESLVTIEGGKEK